MAPFFIVGPHRSGTSLLCHILALINGVSMIFESGLIYNVIEKYGLSGVIDAKICQSLIKDLCCRLIEPATTEGKNLENSFAHMDIPQHLTSSFFDRDLSAKEFLRRGYHFVQGYMGCALLGEKDPGYRFFLNEINHIFPDSKIIYVIRHPYDTLLSSKYHSFKGLNGNPMFHPIAIAILWRNSIRQSIRWSTENPDRMLYVRYEDLVENKHKTFDHICAFLNLPYNGEADYIIGHSSSFTHKKKPILSDVEKYFCNKFCKKEMIFLGYKYEEQEAPLYLRIKCFASLVPYAFSAYYNMRSIHFNMLKFIKVRLRTR